MSGTESIADDNPPARQSAPTVQTESKPETAGAAPSFETPKQRKRYEKVLRRLDNMKASDGGKSTTSTDWFVVGGIAGNEVNFDAFQGTQNVAQRAVEFTTAFGNNCQWRVFYRTSDEAVARQELEGLNLRFEQWVGQQQRLAAAYRDFQIRQAQQSWTRRTRCGPGG